MSKLSLLILFCLLLPMILANEKFRRFQRRGVIEKRQEGGEAVAGALGN